MRDVFGIFWRGVAGWSGHQGSATRYLLTLGHVPDFGDDGWRVHLVARGSAPAKASAGSYSTQYTPLSGGDVLVYCSEALGNEL